ncbi:22383_t:CDS:1, partial [Dentiscutata erythropus]
MLYFKSVLCPYVVKQSDLIRDHVANLKISIDTVRSFILVSSNPVMQLGAENIVSDDTKLVRNTTQPDQTNNFVTLYLMIST